MESRDTSSNLTSKTPKSLEMSKSNLPNQLKFYLEHRELSAAAIARKANVPKQNISGWMAGKRPGDISQVKRVAEVLHTTIDNLLFGNGIEEFSRRVTDIETLMGDGWISGLFEVRLRRIKL